MLKNIPFVDLKLQHQPLESELKKSIQEVLERGDFILGQAVAKFESSFATICGVENAIGVACGTDAIALGLQACGVSAGDEVILPANTFIATLMGVLHAGATPVLVDCDAETALIDLEIAQKAVTNKTKVILPVHLYGQMVAPSKLLDFAQANKLIIFEDAAQAHLAQREGYRAGSIGTAAAFSFYPSKNLGCFGDGGMVVTSDQKVASKMRVLRNYGAPRKYVYEELGTNSRLDTLQAAVLNVKLPYLKGWNSDRNQAAQKYDTLLSPMKEKGIIPIQNLSGTGHIYHLYVIRITDKSPIDRDTLKDKLGVAGISVGIHYPIPCHLQPAYQHLGYKKGDFPNSETLSQQILSLPMYPVISEEQINLVVETIIQIISQ
ncbi:MAG: DegT/DnrJ/EryC1/StrS aminotransferase family protein [Trichodesmium sp. St16_bin4-tuft]|nr:DegT/DnrJ/EryC1/StrS aminotransferase family protein [Trichodesmium sp. St4_bin8_1]MDE5074496.1 DegT/DnrJ/EryC1/StrS aminotransferase family protein [Trichodesmium sp. St5_bin8]MDE5079231.1 DegT/DnrJ/EryC1/StrS aminotransferase family protein [Trichodesmium sp. St2_bin6]MDE5092089.1 DegT/DnrJ/EryC1/StrS aminotransferase family protein [Trichodesmium sp. St18_bin3_1_1]MDE5097231.1 DegT/DnrJ/EryC1/StrS aminotransferase family protein [Trichodesmium sp. St16_bin4-tuft]